MKPGKRFEKNIQDSAEKQGIFYIRVKDPAQSFNIECEGCEKIKTRFSHKNICDAVAYRLPYCYLLELKSVQGKSIPFKNIIKDEKDKRLDKMLEEDIRYQGVRAYVIINFRVEGNPTYALRADKVVKFISMATRKSIPLEYCQNVGIEIESEIKKVNYNYDLERI